MSMITTILPQIGIACMAAAAAALFIVKAKRSAPISRKEATILWKLHKQTCHCKSQKYEIRMTKRGEMTGFKCECGYRYTQKRPLL